MMRHLNAILFLTYFTSSLSFSSLNTKRFSLNSLYDKNFNMNTETEVPCLDSSPKSFRSSIANSLALSSSVFLSTYFIATAASHASTSTSKFPIVASEQLMSKKSHGTTDKPVQSKLKWNVDAALADRICSFNRRWAESYGYWTTTSFLKDETGSKEITFYDSVTGKPLFIAPRGRSFEEWKSESEYHGWPSFRDNEVVWDNVRTLRDGETVSLDGTHLGHNLPDFSGNRYCINLVSIAGNPSI
eukprot:gene13929-29637_t